jgi:hypothetical protein
VGYSARHHRERGEAGGADARCCLASRSARIRRSALGAEEKSARVGHRKGDFSCFALRPSARRSRS